ncbi:2-methylisocitrate lyase-like PEP mutase family enzyme [Caulobacter ginsengisoli]|uniref:2-methylisocitrate lyase-like PEP mutase family enzyme n=1 Tax=Caulobacter ginsengisoli TaxID=400775 RepID=A0ABU0IVI4_9CAUL|nr:isocitrate lyase/phosphoenolpyruvate mutase family protein [Caulobacter ginsengisoli]MDQ0465361.1 2-methylisocitrate lyase-like PEP mutase family enzyme [Caulobacter ginsengisoli]
MTQTQRANAFLALHKAPGGFILGNAWDAGSAILMAAEGFKAIATTSAGVAFSIGKPDYRVGDPRVAVSREETLARLAELTSAVDIPVNADLEDGYGEAPEAVAETVRLAVAAGAAGGNIEDIGAGPDLYDEALSVERIAAARAAAPHFVLNARTDALQIAGPEGLAEAIRRGNRYLEAGADCVFVPGTGDLDLIRTLVREIAGPLNIVVGLTSANATARQMLEAGVQRISTGGSIARAALGLVRRAARELLDEGTFGYGAGQIGQGELNALYSTARLNAGTPEPR